MKKTLKVLFKQKTFILGIGAQRTGSTWLHSQIKKNKQIDMGFCKEYHVFDVLFTPFFSTYKSDLLEKIEHGKKAGGDISKEIKLLSFINDSNNYFDYFDRLYNKKIITEIVGDITPSYSILNAEAYEFIRNGLEKRGFTVKVIFMMRDPVERIWSMFHQAAKVRKAMQTKTTRQATISTFTNPHASMRTRYDRTINELEKVFPKQDIFYGFYETLFNAASYEKLGEFLSLNLVEPEFDLVRNASLMKKPIPENLAIEATKHYALTYNFILKRFGPQLKSLWGGFQYLG